MNIKSINFKIILWFSTILVLATGIIFASFYLVTSKILFQEVDKELLLHSHNPTQFNNVPGMVTTVLDQNGTIKQSSLSYDTPYISYKYLYDTAVKTKSISYINQNIGTTPMRFLVKPIINNGELTEVLLIAHPIQAIENSLNLLITTLFILFIIFILPTIFGAKILAQKVIKPIGDITKNMDDITSENLDNRLVVQNSKDEIEKLTKTFNNLLDRLQDAFTRERQFIGDIAHELKTPLATLKSGIELGLSKKRQNEDYKNILQETLIDTDKMSSLLQNILDLAWIKSDKNNVNNKKFNLSEVLDELNLVATKLAFTKKIKIKSDIKPNIMITADEGKIMRAILNIIENSIKYSSHGSEVFISLYKSQNIAIVIIKDKGVGISKNDLDHIFDRFYRGAKTAKTLGSGLGLAISQGIINTHGGEIKIDSTVGKGTTIKITLPL